MSNVDEITPKELIEWFRKDPNEVGWEKIDKAYRRYESVQDKSGFLEPIINFVEEEAESDDDRADDIRRWGTVALGSMKGTEAEKATKFLHRLLTDESTKEIARRFYWTRFYALRSLVSLAQNPEEKEELLNIIFAIAFNDSEDYLNQAAACALIVLHETSERKDKRDALQKIKAMLSPVEINARGKKFKGYTTKGSLAESFWPALRALDALKEFPLREVRREIIKVVRESPYYEHKANAIQVLGGAGFTRARVYQEKSVVYELGFIVKRNKDSNLRLLAVISLGQIKDPEATGDLLKALVDKNAEIRVKASDALKSTLGKPDALRLVVQEALKEGIEDTEFDYLVNALRRIDNNRQLCADILARELESDDPNRAQRAQKILYDIGGIEALQRLNRRETLEQSYRLLEESEKALKEAFQKTTLQATRNFYFSMIINAVIVGVGIALIGLAVLQVLEKPENLAGWITPGLGGVFGIILTLYFNGPRENAREDLRVLVNANAIYLGFLRMLNIIDATFKHDFVEDPSFGAKNMKESVTKINESLKTVLDLTATHLFLKEKKDAKKGAAPKPENEKPKQQAVPAPLENQ